MYLTYVLGVGRTNSTPQEAGWPNAAPEREDGSPVFRFRLSTPRYDDITRTRTPSPRGDTSANAAPYHAEQDWRYME
jgi:hypothetical protein